MNMKFISLNHLYTFEFDIVIVAILFNDLIIILKLKFYLKTKEKKLTKKNIFFL